MSIVEDVFETVDAAPAEMRAVARTRDEDRRAGADRARPPLKTARRCAA